MIKLTDLVGEIKKAVAQAADALFIHNMHYLKEYFHEEDTKNTELKDIDWGSLTPKMITMNFPKMTKEGPQAHQVFIPLIALAPMNEIKLSEMIIEMDAAIVEDENEISVEFLHSKYGLFGTKKTVKPRSNVKIKITISTHGKNGAIESIVECYNKSIKAQMPL